MRQNKKPETPDTDQDDTPEPETEEPAAQPDLTITITVVSPASVQSGDTVALQVRVQNKGTAPASQESVFIYRHSSETANPKIGGVQIRKTSTGKILTSNASVRGTFRSPAPTVSATKQYYYYACVDTADDEQDTDDNCTIPVQVTVQPKAAPPTETESDDTPDENRTRTGRVNRAPRPLCYRRHCNSQHHSNQAISSPCKQRLPIPARLLQRQKPSESTDTSERQTIRRPVVHENEVLQQPVPLQQETLLP